MMNSPPRVFKPVVKLSILFLTLLATVPAFAQSTNFNIGTASGAGFAGLTTWMQNFVGFLNGPFGTMVVVVSLILAFATWTMAPREGIVGPALRVVVSAIVILNVATWMGTF
jgi:type IV secretory pathway VirB2 component (pilin)